MVLIALKCRSQTSDYLSQRLTVTTFRNGSWVVLSPLENQIKAKIESKGIPLKNWDVQINYGIKTGFNEAFIINDEKRRELIDKCPKADSIIRPILRGRDIRRYCSDSPTQWVIYIPWHFPLHENPNIIGASYVAELEFQKQYPAIYSYLLEYKLPLEQRNQAETGIRYEWYALQRYGSNYWREFEKRKIVWGNLSLGGSYTLAEKNVFINAPSVFIPTDNMYLLAVMNSKLADYYIKQLGVTRNGGYFEYKPMFVEQLPIPILDEKEQCKFQIIVEKILEEKALNNNTIELESMVDEMVYELYGLSHGEITYSHCCCCVFVRIATNIFRRQIYTNLFQTLSRKPAVFVQSFHMI